MQKWVSVEHVVCFDLASKSVDAHGSTCRIPPDLGKVFASKSDLILFGS